jgi:hypothetical protein
MVLDVGRRGDRVQEFGQVFHPSNPVQLARGAKHVAQGDHVHGRALLVEVAHGAVEHPVPFPEEHGLVDHVLDAKD